MSSASEPYCGWPPTPAAIAASWNNDPVLLVALGAAALIGLRLSRPAKLAWWGGIAGPAIVLVSPLCALASALFVATSRRAGRRS